MSICAPDQPTLALWIATAEAMYHEELFRAPDPGGLANWIDLASQDQHADDIRAWMRTTPEWHEKHDTPPILPMPPLPPFPTCSSCPSPTSFDQTLPWTPPIDRNFLRADAWGVPVDGLPFVPGGSSEHPERLLTAFLYKYDRALWPACFAAHKRRGFTHWILWWPNARADGMTVLAFVALCQEIQAAGFYVQVGLNSKDYDPRDQSAASWKAELDPLFDALGAAKAADEYAVWEWDSHNVPGRPTIDAFTYFGQRAHAQGASFWAHFYPEHTSWFKDKDPRGRYGFWDDLGTDVDGLQYQAVPMSLTEPFDAARNWDIGFLQAKLVDTLQQFAKQGNRHKLRAFELSALKQFTRDRPDEDDAHLIGYLACCTKGPATVWGYGNGARRPDGSAL